MGRPRTIYVDSDQLLLAIHRNCTTDLAELHADEAKHREMSAGWSRFPNRWELTCLEDCGLKIDFERLAGRELSSSERARHQEALCALETAELVKIHGLRASRVKLTEAGFEHLRGLGLLPTEASRAEPAGDA